MPDRAAARCATPLTLRKRTPKPVPITPLTRADVLIIIQEHEELMASHAKLPAEWDATGLVIVLMGLALFGLGYVVGWLAPF